jgi:single-strand DNA-binding protein
MRSLNRCIFTGRLGKDPETAPAGSTTVTKFSLAVTDKWKDDKGEKQERTNWVNVAVFNGNGQNVAGILKKGNHVLVEGAIRTSEWDDKETGQKRWGFEIVASQVIFLEKKPDAQLPLTEPKKTRPRAVK